MVDRKKNLPLWNDLPEGMEKIDSDLHGLWKNFPMPKLNTEFSRSMPIAIAENEKELMLSANLPGFVKEEVRLKVSPKTVSIMAEKNKTILERNENSFRQAKTFGSTSRVMTLPSEVDIESVKAKFQDGVLRVVLPKRESKKSQEKSFKFD
jgi:HSP20 family protein